MKLLKAPDLSRYIFIDNSRHQENSSLLFEMHKEPYGFMTNYKTAELQTILRYLELWVKELSGK